MEMEKKPTKQLAHFVAIRVSLNSIISKSNGTTKILVKKTYGLLSSTTKKDKGITVTIATCSTI